MGINIATCHCQMRPLTTSIQLKVTHLPEIPYLKGTTVMGNNNHSNEVLVRRLRLG